MHGKTQGAVVSSYERHNLFIVRIISRAQNGKQLCIIPNAPCRRSRKSALITVSLVHILSSTYSVRCSSGANVIGDRSSQWSSNSDVLYIPIRYKFEINSRRCKYWPEIWKFEVCFSRICDCVQLSNTVLHFCSSNGNFCKFIQQWSVAWIRCDRMMVPSGDTDVRTSFSEVPNIADDRSLAMNICGVHKESRSEFSPMIVLVRLGATSRNTSRGST